MAGNPGHVDKILKLRTALDHKPWPVNVTDKDSHSIITVVTPAMVLTDQLCE